ncbi:hypothetical protein PENTCL1PPCAC_27387, partial [Pristionchus entomophagus]
EESDQEIILEDEVNEDEDVMIVDDKKGVKTTPINGGMNDAYWKKNTQLFLPIIDGVLSLDYTIKASIALLFEVDQFLFDYSLFARLQSAVVSGASVLTSEQLSNPTKRTAYYALTTLHGYGLLPRGFVYLSINLLGEDRTKIRKGLEPLKRLHSSMKGHLNYISKCTEKRVASNKELHEKCLAMQQTVDKHSLWQYPLIFDRVREKWPEFVISAIRENEERETKKMPKEEWNQMKEENNMKEREEKLKGKMASLHHSPFWRINTTIWGLDSEIDGVKVVDTAIKFITELNVRLYGGKLIEKVRIINAKSLPLEDRNIFDRSRQHSLRFLEVAERYSVFAKGILALIIKAIMDDESLINPIIDLLRKIEGPVEENINNMVELSHQFPCGRTMEKDAKVSLTLLNLRSLAKNEIYPHLPSVFNRLKCTRVPSFVAEWMKKSPMTKSSISEWSRQMGVETDLNGFPLRTKEEFVMPEMGDEYLLDEEEKKKKEKKERQKKRGNQEDEKEEEKAIGKKEKKVKKAIVGKKANPVRRPIPPVPPGTKPVALLEQIISNPFGFPPMVPPPTIPPPMMGRMTGMGMVPPFMGGPPSEIPPFNGSFPRSSGLPGLLDIPMDRMAPPRGMNAFNPPSFMRMDRPPIDIPDTSRPPPGREEEEERRKVEKIARLMMGGGENGRREEGERREKRERRDEDEMEERERRLQRWLEEKNGGRRRDERRDDRRRRRSRSRSNEREKDGKADFERRVEELERRKREEKEEKERGLKEISVEHWRKVKGSFKPMDESKWEFRPEWGVTTVWRRVSGHSRWEEKAKDKLDLLTLKIKDHFVNNVQSPEDEQKKKIVVERLQDGMQMKLDTTGVFFLMAGSTPSSFASRNSNLDLVLISPVPTTRPEDIRDLFFPELPYLIMQRGGKMTRQEALWMEFECTMAGTPLKVRIAIDSGAYYFSKIMAIYDSIDARVSALLHYIKHWTATHLRSADDISKYLLTNLVIHFLQSGVSPPILPCLHLLYPARLAPDIFSSFDYASPFDPPLPGCTNTQSLASLFIGFLMYYASFNFSRYAISIRAGTVIRKRDLGVAVPEFAVEHPFDGSYSAVVNDPFTSSHFTAAMTAACQDAITTFDI